MSRQASINWVFTLNNYTEEEIKRLEILSKKYVVVFGEEVAPTTGTRHLQGFVACAKRTERSTLEKVLGGHAWLEPTYDVCAAIGYAIKDGKIHSNDEWMTKRLEEILSIAKKYSNDHGWIGSCVHQFIEDDGPVVDQGQCAFDLWKEESSKGKKLD